MLSAEQYVARRSAATGSARGDVLEIGAGAGRSIPLLPSGVRYVAVEPHAASRRRPRRMLEGRSIAGEVLDARAEALPLADASVDTVLSLTALCSVDDLDATLRGCRRVLRAGGRLVFVEHVRSASARVARLQAAVSPLHARLDRGCRLDRDPVDAARRAGFVVEPLDAADALEEQVSTGIPGVSVRCAIGVARKP